MLKKLVYNASKNRDVKRILSYAAAYNSKENFEYLYDIDIEAAIKVRKKSTSKLISCYPRKVVVIHHLKDFDKWKVTSDIDIHGLRKVYFL
jgi:hypothetical protein